MAEYCEDSFDYEDDNSVLDSDEDEELNFSGADTDEGGTKKGPVTSFQVLTPDMISKKMFDIIHDVNAVFEVCVWVCECTV